MLFQPSHHIDIINDSQYPSKIVTVEDTLSKYANIGYFTSFDGAKMYYEYFCTTENNASIVVVHGYTEFSKKYYELVWYFLNMGYNVFLYDLRGHGYSHRVIEDTEVTHVDYFEDYVKDLDCYINQIVVPNSNNAPIFLYSHSMGGAISTMYLQTCTNNVQKAILSAPMIYPVCIPLPRKLLRILLKNEAKKYGWNAKFRYSSSFNPDAKAKNSMDLSKCRFKHNLNMRINELKFRNSSGSNRWNYEVLSVIDKIFKRKLIKNINAKVLIISAGKDTVVKARPQRKLARLLKCKHICFENAKHSLYTATDIELGKYVRAIVDFYSEA